jgi:hypothetical protein
VGTEPERIALASAHPLRDAGDVLTALLDATRAGDGRLAAHGQEQRRREIEPGAEVGRVLVQCPVVEAPRKHEPAIHLGELADGEIRVAAPVRRPVGRVIRVEPNLPAKGQPDRGRHRETLVPS